MYSQANKNKLVSYPHQKDVNPFEKFQDVSMYQIENNLMQEDFKNQLLKMVNGNNIDALQEIFLQKPMNKEDKILICKLIKFYQINLRNVIPKHESNKIRLKQYKKVDDGPLEILENQIILLKEKNQKSAQKIEKMKGDMIDLHQVFFKRLEECMAVKEIHMHKKLSAKEKPVNEIKLSMKHTHSFQQKKNANDLEKRFEQIESKIKQSRINIEVLDDDEFCELIDFSLEVSRLRSKEEIQNPLYQNYLYKVTESRLIESSEASQRLISSTNQSDLFAMETVVPTSINPQQLKKLKSQSEKIKSGFYQYNLEDSTNCSNDEHRQKQSAEMKDNEIKNSMLESQCIFSMKNHLNVDEQFQYRSVNLYSQKIKQQNLPKMRQTKDKKQEGTNLAKNQSNTQREKIEGSEQGLVKLEQNALESKFVEQSNTQIIDKKSEEVQGARLINFRNNMSGSTRVLSSQKERKTPINPLLNMTPKTFKK